MNVAFLAFGLYTFFDAPFRAIHEIFRLKSTGYNSLDLLRVTDDQFRELLAQYYLNS
jgi:hypothetical protein